MRIAAEAVAEGRLVPVHAVYPSNRHLSPKAAAQLLHAGVRLVLVPYDAARAVEFDAAALARFSQASGAVAWVAAQARDWLSFWRASIGRSGFHPFDVLAAVMTIEPALLRCTETPARVGRDGTLARGTVVHCPEIDALASEWIVRRLAPR